MASTYANCLPESIRKSVCENISKAYSLLKVTSKRTEKL